MHVGDGVGPGHVGDALHRAVAGEPRVGAGVEVARDLARDDAAVAHHAVLDEMPLGPARAAVEHLLLAAEHVAHGPARQHGAEDGQRLGERIDLAAEAAADRAADEVQAVGGHVEQLGGGAEREEQRLRAGVHHEAVVGLGRGDRAVGLGRRVLDGRHLVALFDHEVGRGERALDIAEAQLLVVVLLVVLEGVGRVGLVHHRRAGLDRLLHVEHRRQRVVVDADLGERVVGRGLALGHHRHDRLALVAHLVDGQQRLVVLAEVDEAQQRVLVDRHVGGADHALDAGRALGRRHVDGAQARMRMRAAQHLQMQQALEGMVVEIARAAGDVAQHVLALARLADLVEAVVALVLEVLFPKLEHGPAPRLPARRAWRRHPGWR